MVAPIAEERPGGGLDRAESKLEMAVVLRAQCDLAK